MTVRVQFVVVLPAEFETVITKFGLEGIAVGVPVITPVALMVRPEGSAGLIE